MRNIRSLAAELLKLLVPIVIDLQLVVGRSVGRQAEFD